MTHDEIRAGDEPQSKADVALATPATTVDAEGRHVLVVDVPCIQCGYNLRGLDRETVCPECGGAIERTLRGPWLRYADPRWLYFLCVGTLLLLLKVLLSLSAQALSIIAAWLLVSRH